MRGLPRRGGRRPSHAHRPRLYRHQGPGGRHTRHIGGRLLLGSRPRFHRHLLRPHLPQPHFPRPHLPQPHWPRRGWNWRGGSRCDLRRRRRGRAWRGDRNRHDRSGDDRSGDDGGENGLRLGHRTWQWRQGRTLQPAGGGALRALGVRIAAYGRGAGRQIQPMRFAYDGVFRHSQPAADFGGGKSFRPISTQMTYNVVGPLHLGISLSPGHKIRYPGPRKVSMG